jgi:hypothetical protein
VQSRQVFSGTENPGKIIRFMSSKYATVIFIIKIIYNSHVIDKINLFIFLENTSSPAAQEDPVEPR